MLLSVIVPCYNEEENVPVFYDEMRKNEPFLEQEGLDLEIIYIDDGSKDGTAAQVRRLHEKDPRVHLVSFSRNFGKEAGIYAGFQKAKGDYVVMMDADLQDPPSLLPEMFSWIKQGYDSVATRRVNRKGEPPIRSFFARMFYKLMNKISKTEIVDGARDYRLMTRQVVDAILSMCEYNRFTKGIFGWVGYRTKWLEYETWSGPRGDQVELLEAVFIFHRRDHGVFHGAAGHLFGGGTAVLLRGLRGNRSAGRQNLITHDPVAGWPSMCALSCWFPACSCFVWAFWGNICPKHIWK